MTEGLANIFQTTVGVGGIASGTGATSLPVNDAAPTALRGVTFAIVVNPGGANQEIMEVTATGAAGASPWTVTRASEPLGATGTQTASAHVATEPVWAVLTAQGLKNILGSGQVIRTSLSTAFTVSSAIAKVLLSGSFTPTTTRGRIRAELAAGVFGLAFANVNFLWGTPSTPLYQAAATAGGGLNAKAGVTNEWCGDIGPAGATPGALGYVGKTVPLSGLTPGTTYNWQLVVGITSGTIQIPAAGIGGSSGQSDVIGTIDRRKLYISNLNGSWIDILNTDYSLGSSAMGDLHAHPQYGGRISPVGTGFPLGPNQLAMTPDGTRLLSANANGTVTVIDTSTDTIIATYTIPGVSPLGYGICCPNNTTAYVSDATNAKVHSMTIATGVFDSATSAPYTTGTTPRRMRAQPNGAGVYVGCHGTNQVQYITVPGGVTSTVTLTAGAAINDLAMAPDGTILACVDDAHSTVIGIAVPANTVSWTSTAMNHKPNSIAIDADSLTAWVGAVTTTGVAGATGQLWIAGGYPGSWFDNDITMPAPANWQIQGMYIDTFGNISEAEYNNGQFWQWPGAFFQCDPTSGFANQFAHVIYEDVA